MKPPMLTQLVLLTLLAAGPALAGEPTAEELLQRYDGGGGNRSRNKAEEKPSAGRAVAG